MSDLVEYFVRHYTLVMDNDQGPYEACREATRAAILAESPDLTLAQYKAMSDQDRERTYAEPIGASILSLIEEWTHEVTESFGDHIGALLIREVLIIDGSDLAWELGKHYIPEDADAEDFLSDEDDEDDDEACPCGKSHTRGEHGLGR